MKYMKRMLKQMIFLGAGDGTVKYVATSSKPMVKSSLSNHRSITAPVGSGLKREGLSRPTLSNGDGVRKKTLREMLASIPGFSMKVLVFLFAFLISIK